MLRCSTHFDWEMIFCPQPNREVVCAGQASSFGQLSDGECIGLADSLLAAFKESARFCEDCWCFLPFSM